MSWANKIKIALLVVGDIVALYAALFITLILRYGGNFYTEFTEKHFLPFSMVFVIWIIILYIGGLYDLRRLRNNLNFLKVLFLAVSINAALSILFFYLVPTFGIAPKTNLFVFIAFFIVIETLWRRSFNSRNAHGEAPNKVLFLGNNGSTREIKNILLENPQLGYEEKVNLNGDSADFDEINILDELALEKGINVVVVPRHLKRNERISSALYNLLTRGVIVYDSTNFYELIARKIPLSDIEESWFLENLYEPQKFYDPLKRAWELLAALIIGVILLPFEVIFALLVKTTSPGPAIYKQKRVGQHGQEFTLFKFRTMIANAEKNGAQWTAPEDKRVTPFGRFLRHTHLDELPQLWNIVKGELSFVGPRPERPEFVKPLKEKIPYYEVRLLVKPGVTGWAQINHRSDISTEDVVEKLQYDIYYIKNRSPILDLAIILKTLKTLFITPK